MSFFSRFFQNPLQNAVQGLTTTTGTSSITYPYNTQPAIQNYPFGTLLPQTAGYGQFGVPTVTEALPKEVTVPVFDVNDSKRGVFIRDKEGKLNYHTIEEIIKTLGYEW